MRIIDQDLISIQEARILSENARHAQKEMATFSQEKLDGIVERMIDGIEKYSEELAKKSYAETDYGNWQDKQIKNNFVCNFLREKLRGLNCVGIIAENQSEKTFDVGVPLGVIVALSPATNPVSTTIYKTLIAIKSGNTIIFSPHPRAQKVISETLDILIRTATESGLPEGAISYLHTVTLGGTKELINHPATSLIMNTGVPSMLEAAYASGKQVIYGGHGNGPVFIERTADIKQAVADIISSKTFDNGIVVAAEQSIVVDSCISAEVKCELEANGAYFMTESESKRLGELLFAADGSIDSEMVGKSAQVLAKRASIVVSPEIKLLISEQKYITQDNPYAKEKLCPVLAYFIEDDWMNACEKCIEILLSEKSGHTLVIHSNDKEVIKQFVLKKPVGRVLVNTPATFGSMGATTNLFPAMTLGSGSAGEGMTADNVSPMNLIYIRKVGYGVRSTEETKARLLGKEAQQITDLGINLNLKNKTEVLSTLEKLLVELKK